MTIQNTSTLDPDTYSKYLRNMRERIILRLNEHDEYAPSRTFLFGLDSFEKMGLADNVRAEVGNDLVSKTIIFGIVLAPYKLSDEELFHYINIISKIVGHLQIEKSQLYVIEWIRLFTSSIQPTIEKHRKDMGVTF